MAPEIGTGENTRQDETTVRVLRTVALAALSLLAIYLCWKLAAPFLSPLTWGLALAVACAPLRARLFTRLPPLAATLLIVALVIVIIAAPLTFILRQLFQESLALQGRIRMWIQSDDWRQVIASHPVLGPVWTWADQQFDLSELAQKAAGAIARAIAPALARSAGVISQTGVALLAFFFFLRDQEIVLTALRRMLPLSRHEADALFARISSAVESCVYGRIFIGCVQGALGGLIFAIVGISAAVFWGAVMSLLSILPVVGAFVVWVPASMFLLLGGHWIKAVIVIAWGMAVIHPVDNLLYPILVSGRMGMHSLVLFIAFLGGLIAFGPAGLILGPCIVAAAMGLADFWQDRNGPAVRVAEA